MNFSTNLLEEQMRKLNELNGDLPYRITRLSKLLDIEAAQRLRGSGINLTTYRILRVVAIYEEISVSDLARTMVIDRAQISRLAADLARKGHLTSKPDRSNRLKKLLMLTDEGRALFERLSLKFANAPDALTRHVAVDNLDALWRLLDQASQALTARINQEG